MQPANFPAAAEPERPPPEADDRRFVGLLRGFLAVVDAIHAYAESSDDPRVQKIRHDVLRALLAVGVRPVALVGGRFDPRHHEAISIEPGSSLPPDAIARVVQAGFQWAPLDRPPVLLRSAKVIVTSAATPTSQDAS